MQDLSERKKMQFLQPVACVNYMPCRLTEGKEWYITYYVQDPETRKLKRIRIKLNRIKPISQRRKVAKSMMAALDQRLSLGWNPLLEEKAPRANTHLFAAMDSFLKVKGKETEDNSMRSYRSFIKTFKAWLTAQGFNEETYCCTVTKDVALSFMDDVESELSAKTFNNYITFYRILFNWMEAKGYVDGNPFNDIVKKARRLIKKVRRVMTDGELSRLWSYLQAENPEYLTMCLICYCCFIRPKEIALLRCADIDLVHQVIHVKQEVAKNDNDSYRTIPDDLMPFLRRLDLSRPDWYVFGQHEHGDFRPGPVKMCSRKIAQWWNLHVRPACNFGMDIQFYSLKDTGITNMIGEGTAINLVQQQADHSSLAMTAIYVGKKTDASEELKATKILNIPKPAGNLTP